MKCACSCRSGICGEQGSSLAGMSLSTNGRDVGSLASTYGGDAETSPPSHLPEVDINDDWGVPSPRYSTLEEPVHTAVATTDANVGCAEAGPIPSSPWPGPQGLPSEEGDPIAKLEQMLALPGTQYPAVPPDGGGRGNGKASKRWNIAQRREKKAADDERDSLPPLPRSDEINSMDDPVAKLEDLLMRPGAVHPTMPPPDYADIQLQRLKELDPDAFKGRKHPRISFKRKNAVRRPRWASQLPWLCVLHGNLLWFCLCVVALRKAGGLRGHRCGAAGGIGAVEFAVLTRSLSFWALGW